MKKIGSKVIKSIKSDREQVICLIYLSLSYSADMKKKSG